MDIGGKIHALRVRNSLTQEELAKRCDLSKGFISQLERDLTSPSIATLIDILECLGTDLQNFFNERQQENIVYAPQDIFVSADDAHGMTTAWLVPNAQKNAMEPILVTLEAGCSTPIDEPHPGEEFGFVLKGGVSVHLGDASHKARKGSSFTYRPTQPHYIENNGKTAASILWVADPPSF